MISIEAGQEISLYWMSDLQRAKGNQGNESHSKNPLSAFQWDHYGTAELRAHVASLIQT